MISFAAILTREQPRINKVLSDLVDALPAAVRPVARHTLDAGGKRLRPLLMLYMARTLGYRQDDIYTLAATIEFFHMATLIHDDVLDHAELRRGRPAAHHVFGLGRAVLAADALFSHGCRCVANMGDSRLVSCLTDAVVRTTTGEIEEFDLQGRILDSLDPYYGVISGKTAWMLRAAAELGALRAGASAETVEAAAQYGLNLGMAFQIADDALDFDPPSRTGKPEGGDVREAKFTPPIFYYYHDLPQSEQDEFSRKFTQRSFSDHDIHHIVFAVRDGGYQRRTLDLADGFLQRAADALSRVKPPDADAARAHAALAAALTYVRDRTQ